MRLFPRAHGNALFEMAHGRTAASFFPRFDPATGQRNLISPTQARLAPDDNTRVEPTEQRPLTAFFMDLAQRMLRRPPTRP